MPVRAVLLCVRDDSAMWRSRGRHAPIGNMTSQHDPSAAHRGEPPTRWDPTKFPTRTRHHSMTEHHDRDTVVVRDGGSNLGTILGALLVIALLIAVWYFTLGPGGNPGGGAGTDTDTNSS